MVRVKPPRTARHLAAAVMVCGILSLSGCIDPTQPHRRIDQYVLEYSPPEANTAVHADKGLRVARFRVAPQYNSTRIFYRSEAFVRNHYEYHRWRAHPGDMVAFFLSRDLRAAGLFSGVYLGETIADPDLRLEGTVDEIYEDDAGTNRQAVLSITVSLLGQNGDDIVEQLLWQQDYSARESCSDRSPASLAAAMSRSMARISAAVIEDLRRVLAEAQ